MSEQNHASILCNLNNGHTKNNTYCEEPMTLFKDLMERNRLHGIRMNKMLADADNAMVGVIEELKNGKQSNKKIDLLKAAYALCKPEFERYKDKRKRSDECLILQKDKVSEKVTVSDITNSLSKQRTFLSQGQRCDCNECITEETQCSHEIKFWGGFRPSLFQPRHFC